MHLSLLNNRPAANTSSSEEELLDFTMARYIRVRLQRMHATLQTENNVQWLVDMPALEKRSFYSIRHIKIGARAICNGHASKTRESEDDEEVRLNNNKLKFNKINHTFCIF